MSFMRLELLPIVGMVWIFFILVSIRQDKKFYSWVKDHWMVTRSANNRFSGILNIFAWSLLFLSVLDLRGPETLVEGKKSDQKTLIMIDTSTSMLAEDVRPNRFDRAYLLAKHFIKKAVGHQLSLVVFSDSHKQIVPFTDDVDLIEARLDSLKEMDLSRGGTNLRSTLQESAQYFLSTGGEGYELGNVLVLTDAEETVDGFAMNFPSEISVAVVGIGTAKGSKIPVRDSRGGFRGNKQYDGEDIVTKLDEALLKKLSNEIKEYRYWVAGSYSMPTEEILTYFNRSLKTKEGETTVRLRPVLANYLLVPAIILFICAYIMRSMKAFTLPMLWVVMMFFNIENKAYAQNSDEKNNQKKPPEKTESIEKLEKKLLEDRLNESGKKQLAYEFLKEGFYEKSAQLYDEILPEKISDSYINEFFNKATAQAQSGKTQEGLSAYTDIINFLKDRQDSKSKDLLNKTKSNLLNFIKEQDKKKEERKQKNNEKKQNEKQENKNDQNKEQSDQESDKDQENGQGEEGDGDESPRSDQGGSSEENPESGKNDPHQNNKKGENQDDKSEDESNENGSEKNEMENDKKRQGESVDEVEGSQAKGEKGDNKMPAILKQLMSDDNQLQKKAIDTKTVEGKTREKKDW